MSRFRVAALAVAALLVAALLLPVVTPNLAAQDAADEEATPLARIISTSGTGRVTVQPDRAVISLGVTTQAEEAAAAMDQNSEQMQAVVDALVAAGIPEEDIQTRILNLNPRYDQPQPPDQTSGQLIGYEASNLVEVRLEDVGTIGSVIDAAVQAGANQIQSMRWEVSDQVDVLDQAREAAWQDALHKAEQLAGLAGGELGQVVTLNESSGPIIPFYADVAREAALAIPIQPGTQDVEITIQVTWQLVDSVSGANGAPATPATGATGTPAARATATPATGATVTPTTEAAAPDDEVTIEIVADGNAFDLDSITVPAGAHVVIEFTNEDSVRHNVAVYTDDSAEEEIFVGDTITGPGETITYEFDAPEEAGTYFFRCDVHPTMNGDFVVE